MVTLHWRAAQLFAVLALPCGCTADLARDSEPVSTQSVAIATPPMGKVTVAYYNGVHSHRLPVLSIPAGSLSHINYVGAKIGPNDSCIYRDPAADPSKVSELNGPLKASYPALKTSFTVQGAAEIAGAASSAARRATMAAACVEFMVAGGFDGIDIDWEYPTGVAEGTNYVLLLQALRSALDARSAQTGKSYFLTIAAPATRWEYQKLNLSAIAASVNWLNLMTYDFHGPWSKKTGHNSPLYPMQASSSDTLTCDGGVRAYRAAGVPASKIVMGVPFYAYEWYDVSNTPNNNGLRRDSTRAAPPYGRSFTFRQLLDLRKIALTSSYPPGSVAGAESGLHSYRWGRSKVPWLFPPGGENVGNFISYDDPQSICEKARYIHTPPSGGTLRGAMIWDVTMDSASFHLLDALNFCMAN